LLMVACSCALLISCASLSEIPLTRLGTPEHHVVTGMKLLDHGKYVDARREFELALKLSPDYAMAYAGLGLIGACNGDFKGGLDFLVRADKLIKTDAEKAFVALALIRFNTLRHIACQRALEPSLCAADQSNWLEDSKEAFSIAVKGDKKAAPYLFLGEAYLQAFELEKAAGMFQIVLDLKEDYVEKAENHLKLIGKIRELKPKTAIGRRVACAQDVNRAEVAALFVDELKVKNLIRRKAFRDFEKTIPLAKDALSCRLFSSIEDAVKLGIEGLHVYPDGNFRPRDLITRADYAVMIEDIVAKASGEKAVELKGFRSPFYDVPADHAFFRAVMFVTARGFMEPVGQLSGSFSPFEQLSGIDAVFAIKKVEAYLQTRR